MDGVDKSVR